MSKGKRPTTVTPIAPALEVDDASAIDWSDSADVVVPISFNPSGG